MRNNIIMSIFIQIMDFLALVTLPVDGATRPQGWAHLLQGQTPDSHWVEESGRYLLKSIKKKTQRRTEKVGIMRQKGFGPNEDE